MMPLVRTLMLSMFTVAAVSAQAAPRDVPVWHALPGPSAQAFSELVSRYNASQTADRIVPVAHTSLAALRDASVAAAGREGGPHLLQVADVDSGELLALGNGVIPLHRLLAAHPIPDLQWFLPQSTQFMRNGNGQLMALPLMAQAPMLFINREAYQKAGLDPDKPPRTWREMQGHLIALQAAGYTCPYASSWQSWIHLENLAAIHNQPWASRNNGFDGPGAELLANRLLHVRHVSLMMSWVRSNLKVAYSNGPEADARFASGECGVLTSGSGAWGSIAGAGKVRVTVAPLPFYDEEAAQPANPFIGGSSFWVAAGLSNEQQASVARFMAWLATPTVAAEWHQRTGYLPLTDAAWRAAQVSFYGSIPGAAQVVQALSQSSAPFTRGFRLRGYASVRAVLDAELAEVWADRKPPMLALGDATRRANLLVGAMPAPAGAATRPAAQRPAQGQGRPAQGQRPQQAPRPAQTQPRQPQGQAPATRPAS